jgi:hypothetical protein
MVDLLCKRFGYSAIDAYMLSFYFLRIVLE